ADCQLSDIVKVNIYLLDMADFPALNALYADWLGDHRPARATVAVAALPLGARVEMDVIARCA
ncbi:MAG: Rid family hydrolase, partial [Mariprofundaceae bacterium]|nr:Rid family hydrolase [Mariprofundaceae bacterium]